MESVSASIVLYVVCSLEDMRFEIWERPVYFDDLGLVVYWIRYLWCRSPLRLGLWYMVSYAAGAGYESTQRRCWRSEWCLVTFSNPYREHQFSHTPMTKLLRTPKQETRLGIITLERRAIWMKDSFGGYISWLVYSNYGIEIRNWIQRSPIAPLYRK